MNGRTVLLYDERAHPPCWNERMTSGEYAVHYSSFADGSGGNPYCTVFGNLQAAEAHARQETARRPDLRCRIYDDEGFSKPALSEFKGREYKDDVSIGPRFRRWGGGLLFFGGLILTIIDWRSDFELSWPAMIGTRLLAPGLVLLVTDVVIVLTERRRKLRASEKSAG